jgi:glyoxalase-like protein
MSDVLDHIIWACDDLERGTRRFEALTGVTARYGGVHASGLTHNALVGLGPRCYLEILAPTGPEAPAGREAPAEDALCRLARTAREPRILTYCLRTSRPLSQLAQIAAGAGAHNALVASNGRVTPEGVRLNWQWLAPAFDRFGLAFPFFIDWLDSPHPAATAPNPGDVGLTDFAVGHPQADDLRRTLSELGAPIATYAAAAIEFRVQLRTPLGTVSL